MPCPVAGREPTAPIYPHLLFAFAFFDILLLEIKKSVKPKGSPFLFFFFLEEKAKMTLVLACRGKRGYISHSKYSFGKYTNVSSHKKSEASEYLPHFGAFATSTTS